MTTHKGEHKAGKKTIETMVKGKCGELDIRTRQWKAGFTIKCLRIQKTLMSAPFNQIHFENERQSFCWNCSMNPIHKSKEIEKNEKR